MKSIGFFICWLGFTWSAMGGVAWAQMKVGNSPASLNANAVLEVEHSSKGVLFPRVALTGTANTSPLSTHVQGMVVYNTATAGDVKPGLYENSGSAWVRLGNNSATCACGDIKTSLRTANHDDWQLATTGGTFTCPSGGSYRLVMPRARS